MVVCVYVSGDLSRCNTPLAQCQLASASEVHVDQYNGGSFLLLFNKWKYVMNQQLHPKNIHITHQKPGWHVHQGQDFSVFFRINLLTVIISLPRYCLLTRKREVLVFVWYNRLWSLLLCLLLTISTWQNEYKGFLSDLEEAARETAIFCV